MPEVAERTAQATATESLNNPEMLAEHLSKQDMPAFGSTLRDVLETTADENASLLNIAKIVLRDPMLTANVLRQANSAHYMRNGMRVATVTRAVVVLGANTIKSMCAAALMLQTMEQGVVHAERIEKVLAKGLHAAVQARDLALKKHHTTDYAEKQFVEALLSVIGELAFWKHGDPFAQQVEDLLQKGVPADVAERQVLGYTLEDLNNQLLEQWSLSTHPSYEVQCALKLSRATQNGWDSTEAREALREISKTLHKPEHEVLEMLQKNAKAAQPLALSQGFRAVANSLPADPVSGEDDTITLPAYPEPDATAQLQTLQEMLKVSRGKADASQLLNITLEGLTRAAGMDRVTFALLSKDRSKFHARLSMGPGSEELHTRFNFTNSSYFEKRLKEQGCAWFKAGDEQPHEVKIAGKASECLMGPLTVDGRLIGFFYADRRPSGRPVDAGLLTSFQLFVDQCATLFGMLR
jgi:HD-like signal output (HDOD) protein